MEVIIKYLIIKRHELDSNVDKYQNSLNLGDHYLFVLFMFFFFLLIYFIFVLLSFNHMHVFVLQLFSRMEHVTYHVLFGLPIFFSSLFSLTIFSFKKHFLSLFRSRNASAPIVKNDVPLNKHGVSFSLPYMQEDSFAITLIFTHRTRLPARTLCTLIYWLSCYSLPPLGPHCQVKVKCSVATS